MKTILLILTVICLSGCVSYEPTYKQGREKNKTPIEERSRLPHYDYSATAEYGADGIWVQPIGKVGEPTPEMIFHPMKTY